MSSAASNSNMECELIAYALNNIMHNALYN